MGQVFPSLEKIGAISYATSIITLAASRLTIGGQQYVTSSLQVATGTLSVNTIYMVYAVVSAGVVSLVTSTNMNSVGPAGYTAWKLVGAFITIGDGTFGAFLSINDTPTCEEFFQGITAITATGSNPTKGSVTPADRVMVTVNGEKARIRMEYRQTAAGSAGSGDYLFATPYTMNANKVFLDTTVEGATKWSGISVIGSGQAEASTENAVCVVVPYDATHVKLGGITPTAVGVVGSSFCNTLAQNPGSLSLDFEVAIDGWSNIPLKDR